MYTIEIERNGRLLCTVGAPNAIMFSANIYLFIEGPSTATLDVRGMNDLGGERKSHTTWLELLELAEKDVVVFHLAERETVSPPVAEVTTDSAEHLAGRERYEEMLTERPQTPRDIERAFPDATLQLDLPNSDPIVASFDGGREFISLRLLWNHLQPDRCHVSLSSFSQREALVRSGGKGWFSGILKSGEACSAKLNP